MKRNIINRSALRRAFLEQSGQWQSGRRNMPAALLAACVAACQSAVALQVARFAAEPKATKNKPQKPTP